MCNFKVCEHGKCKDHAPDWEKISEPEIISNPFYGLKQIFGKRCCNSFMKRVKKVVKVKCLKCGRQDYEIIQDYIALCECCGREESYASAD